ncbi:MAG: rhomboid family intramembrane serine protease [Armatimonadota bacterium]|nr:rhomboid family intramembrane serine protease [Armatimonadota bacterium]MDR7485469.1 rhomboid family intramembrane serine protease [Armatimonadota bacterium]MDR7536814.1 rhomboid family intramembrane serine protease [Armatimonadota bacterium]
MTWTLIGANAATFLLEFVGGLAVLPPLAFFAPRALQAPWTFLTYPLLGTGGVIWLLLGGYMLWAFGGSLERAWGRRDFLVFLVVVTAVPAAALWTGSLATGRTATLAGPWLVLAAAVVAWAAVNPSERLLVYFVVPVQARWLGALAAVLAFFSVPFPLGVFALAGCGAAWWYATGGRFRLFRLVPPRRVRRTAGRRLEDRPAGWNPLERIRRWRRRRQFARLMRRAGLHD